MDKEKMMGEILRKSQVFFLENLNSKICKVTSDLAHYNISGEEQYLDRIITFFHSINGTAHTLGLKKIARIGQKLEIFLTQESRDQNRDVLVSTMFYGVSAAILEFEVLREQFNLKDNLESGLIDFAKEQGTPQKNSNSQILIIDDDESIIYYLSSFLTSKGFKVFGARSRDEALEKMRREEVDVIISDILLGGENGINTYKTLTEGKHHIPVIFMTGITKMDEYFKDHKVPFIKKPIDLLVLLSKLDELSQIEWDNEILHFVDHDLQTAITDSEVKVNKHRRVLIIDDDESFVNFIRMSLEDEYLVDTAFDGDEGILKTIELRPDFVLLDIMIPKVDGFRVLHSLRTNVENFHSKIIILSAKSRNDSIIKAFELGADDFVSKPVDPDELKLRLIRLK
jgi:DNA-binding response OmpR family regulator